MPSAAGRSGPHTIDDRYQLLEVLGEGGTGTVHRALDAALGREVALKVLHSPGIGDDEFRLLAALSHPGLAEVHDYGTTAEGLPYFTLELLRGEDLKTFVSMRLGRGAKLARDRAFREVVAQVLAALDFLHSRGVVHEDLKPSNIIVEPAPRAAGTSERTPARGPRARLIDFGLARLADRPRLEAGGTVEYMAPEKLRGGRGTARSDLYSLGAVLFELFSGEPPFRGPTPLDVVRAHREGAALPPELAAIPPPFQKVVERLLQRSPSERPGSAFEVHQALFGRDLELPGLLPSFAGAFVGREEVLGRLIALSERAQAGKGGAVLLWGESGIGKSRLLRELRARLQLEGIKVAAADPRQAGKQPGETLGRLLRALGFEEDGSSGPAQELSAEAARERLVHRAAERVLAAAAERPVAILVDDLQWADSLDLQFLAHLLRRIRVAERAAVALFLAARSERDEDLRAAAELAKEAGALGLLEEVSLGGLGEAEVRAYLVQVLGSLEAFPEDLPRALARDTGGNPFFLEELLKLAGDRGGIVRDGSRWRVRPGFTVETPGSVQEVIGRRLERLTAAERDLLAWAAVLDEPFSALDLQRRLPAVSLEEVERALGGLVLAQVLGRGGRYYSLLHRRVGAVAYDALPAPERRRRHGEVAGELLAQGSLEAERRLERVAHHLFHSDRPELAREHLLRAGERAQRSGALREAAAHLTRALELAGAGRERFRALLDRQAVLGLLGERERESEDLRRLSELARSLGDPASAAEVLVREAVHLDAAGKKREALEKYEEALALVRKAQDRRGEARVLARKAMAGILLGEFAPALAALERSVEIARAEADRAQEAECRQMLGVGWYFQARYDEALLEMERALAIRRDLGEEHRVSTLESNIGLIHLDRGDLEAAEERFRSSLKVSRAIGFRRGEAVNLVNLGLASSEAGRYERALDFIGEALRIRRELGDRWGEGADLGNLGTVYLKLGRFERAVPLLEEALAIARECGNRGSEGTNECKLGIVDLHRGELARARARFERGRETARALRLSPLEVLSGSLLARAARAAGDPALAVVEVEGALAAARRAAMAGWTIECLALKAAALLDAERRDEALQASGEAVERLRRLRGPSDRSHEVWHVRHVVLDAVRDALGAGDPRAREAGEEADEALRLAHAHLGEKAEGIRDPDLRAGYLQNLPLHRAIAEAARSLREAAGSGPSRRERSLYEISKSINSILDLEPLLDRLLDLAVETTRAEKGMILLADLAGRFTVKSARDMAQESIADAAAICRSVISDVSRRGEPILATDAKADERFRERKSIIDFQIRSLLCVPLTVRGELIGAVYVDSRGETAFQREDLEYLDSFAHLAAIAIENARLLGRLREENLHLRREVETRYRFENLIGGSAAMRALYSTMEKVARTPASVLITGETGTGKELIARALHYHGPRKERPFVAVDCGALPENLLESELFGHKRGAFSGALHDRVGLFEEAEGGTIFLDEVTNTTPDLQAKLLRVLQEGEVRRVGENQYRKVDVRVIAATNLAIDEAVKAGRFREDLYYRLKVVPLVVPPLRERREDIPTLAAHFLGKCRERLGRKVEGFTEEAMAALVRAPWRGNVRELEHAIEKAVILTDQDRIGLEALDGLAPEAAAAPAGASPAPAAPRAPFDFADLSLAEFDRRWLDLESAYLRQLVERAAGNYSQAARLARVRNRNTLIARLKRHGIGR